VEILPFTKTMIDVARLQAYLRHSATRQYETLSVPPFTLFFHPHDPFPAFSYAIPDGPVSELGAKTRQRLRAAFDARGRKARFEFLEPFAPALPALLEEVGFVRETRQPFLVCTAENYRPLHPAPELNVVVLDLTSPWTDFSLFLTAQRRGFDPTYRGQATRVEAEHFRQMLGQGFALLARYDDSPAAVALVTEAHGGVAELTGIATLQPYRRRGFATRLTARALQLAFAGQVEIACLTAEDHAASRLYQRIGFMPVATMLSYKDVLVADH
jgi:ribosomal protein S18 acetylase RimI-like enzyme